MQQTSMFSIKKREADICRRKHGGAETSVDADKHVQKTRDRELIYDYIRAAGQYGYTLDELSVMLDRPPNRISGRVTELRVAGRIVTSDQTRLTRSGCKARVYVTDCNLT